MPRFRTSLALALLLGTAGSAAFAGTVYVPLATDIALGSTQYQTEVWVSNRGTVIRRFDALFIENGKDGTVRAGLTPSSVRVSNGATFQLSGVAPQNKTGMLEISGPDPLVVSARLTGARGVGTTIPVVSSENLVAAGQTANLLGLQRDSERIANLAVLNLGRQAATCSLQLVRSTGVVIGSTVQVTLPPLSNRLFGDVLAPETNISGARAAITCNQPFYAYAASFHVPSGQAAISGPAVGTDSDLTAPGGGSPLCGAATAGVRCFDQAGVFFTPSRAVPTKRLVLPFPNGVEYTKVRAQLDITHGGWYGPKRDGIHNFFWLVQGGNVDRIGYLNTRGPGRNIVYAVHSIGLPRGADGRRLLGNFAMQQGETYHIDYSYDPKSKVVELKMTDKRTGQLVVNLSDNVVFTRRIFTTSSPYMINFALHDEAADSPTFNWKYANLKIEFFNE